MSTPRAKESQIKIIESKLSREKQKFEELNSQEMSLLVQLSDLEQEVTDKRRVIEKLRKRIRLAGIEDRKMNLELAEFTQSLKNKEVQIARRLVVFYKYARKGSIKILATAADPDQFWKRVKYLKAIIENDRRTIVRLAEERGEIEREISLIKRQIAEREAIENEEKMRLSSLSEALEKKVIYLMKIHKEKEFYETAVKELQLAAQNMKQTMLNLEKRGNPKKSWSSRFPSSKGQLPFPLEGKVIKGDKILGYERLNLHKKGVFIEASSDFEVKAVFPGRVDFSGNLKGYGEIIIMNHGSRFFTICAHLSQRNRQEGDVVEGGEIIGSAGRNGSSNGGRLYFEIRRAGKNLDPLKWLKAQ